MKKCILYCFKKLKNRIVQGDKIREIIIHVEEWIWSSSIIPFIIG